MSWPYKAALFPRVIGRPLITLGVVEALLCLFGRERTGAGTAADFQMSKEFDAAVVRRRTASIFLWMVGFFALILFAGFPLAVPLFVFAYLRLAGKEGWVATILLTLFSWIFVEGLFSRLLHIPFQDGWLISLLGFLPI
jgi:hypothetical protein